jgi:hypothetical protein
MFDVTPLVPEARQPTLAAAHVYWRHTCPWFVGLLVHGSALKGGVIAGCSDIDLQLFLTDAAFAPTGHLSLPISIAIQRDLAQIDPTPFQYIQCYAVPARLPPDVQQGWENPIPGTYHMVAGFLPVPEATRPQVIARVKQFLDTLQPDTLPIARQLLEHGGGRLERAVRLLCTDVWPTLYNVIAWQAPNPLDVWALSKEAAMAQLSAEDRLGQAIWCFYQAIIAYYQGAQRVDEALVVIERGVTFLHLARDWYRSMENKDHT